MIEEEVLTALRVVPRRGFVEKGQVREITARALSYLRAGYPVHLQGPAGTGKTTLALHIAGCLARPVILIHGDDQYGSSDLVGANQGYRRSRIVDNFIHSVLKTEETMQNQWVDNRLTTACKNGFTLVYDEFTRSRPEANNVLLSVLEERVLDLPRGQAEDPYLEVHPDFRAIFTSNPEEYAGIHKTQDALLDRMICIRLEEYDFPTEAAIAAARSGLDQEQCERIVRLVRGLRQLGIQNHRPTIRASIMVARLTRLRGARAEAANAEFLKICTDVFNVDTVKVTRGGRSLMSEHVQESIRKICGAPLRSSVGAGT